MFPRKISQTISNAAVSIVIYVFIVFHVRKIRHVLSEIIQIKVSLRMLLRYEII